MQQRVPPCNATGKSAAPALNPHAASRLWLRGYQIGHVVVRIVLLHCPFNLVAVQRHAKGAQPFLHFCHRYTYVASGDKKYLLIRDDRGNQVATPRDGVGWLEPTIKPKATWSWWGKFPAPPADRKTYSLYLKVGPPIDDVPIIDKP